MVPAVARRARHFPAPLARTLSEHHHREVFNPPVQCQRSGLCKVVLNSQNLESVRLSELSVGKYGDMSFHGMTMKKEKASDFPLRREYNPISISKWSRRHSAQAIHFTDSHPESPADHGQLWHPYMIRNPIYRRRSGGEQFGSPFLTV